MTGIYKIESLIKPNKIYIGSAINLTHRKAQHFHLLRENKHYNKKLQSHYNKYGVSDLMFSIILECDKEDLIKHEQFFIDGLGPWFNNRPVAGNNFGLKMSEASRKKIGDVQRGKKQSEETKRKRAAAIRGIKRSDQTKFKQRFAQLGKRHSEETKRKLSESHKGLKNNLGYKWSEEAKKKQSEKMKGRITHPPATSETREKIRQNMLGNNRGYRRKIA